MSRIELDGLSACAPDGTAAVLHEISLAVEDGELLTVVGPSGSGKTTLLRALVGLADTPAGPVRVDGEDDTDWAPAERDMAMQFQDHAPYPHPGPGQPRAAAAAGRAAPRARWPSGSGRWPTGCS
jgi:ABC-type sugar transport system ATPase subunit